MIKPFVALAFALSLARLSYAQTYLPDTVRVNKLTTTYLIFPAKVSLVDISPEYLVKIESGNIVFVRPRLTTARKTPFFVRTEAGTYLGYLNVSTKTSPPAFVEVSKLINPAPNELAAAPVKANQPNPVVTPIPFPVAPASDNGSLLASANAVVGVPVPAEKTTACTPVTVERNRLQIQLDSLLGNPANRHDRDRNSGISVTLTHLVHDSANTYIQLTIRNKTAMPFLLDQVSCWYQHQAKKRKGAYLDGETYPMEPVWKNIPERVEADQQVQVRFVLPQFAPQSRSRFVINVREKNGTRNVTLSLPMKSVLYARARHQPTAGAKQKFFQRDTIQLSFLTQIWHERKRKQ